MTSPCISMPSPSIEADILIGWINACTVSKWHSYLDLLGSRYDPERVEMPRKRLTPTQHLLTSRWPTNPRLHAAVKHMALSVYYYAHKAVDQLVDGTILLLSILRPGSIDLRVYALEYAMASSLLSVTGRHSALDLTHTSILRSLTATSEIGQMDTNGASGLIRRSDPSTEQERPAITNVARRIE